MVILRQRKPHVIADRASRILKARKIISIVGQRRFDECHRILEVGCGSGIISSTLANLGGTAKRIEAVDVVDNRTEKHGYHFTTVTGSALPFDAAAFDLVISNHVIEHVGDEAAQLAHLREIRRVASPGGIAYLAVPNKWRLVEPHYRLPLLSWLPVPIGNAYVHILRGAEWYDCSPRSRRHLIRLFDAAGLAHSDRTIDAARTALALEHPAHVITKVVNGACPDWILHLGMPIVPTFVFLLRPKTK